MIYRWVVTMRIAKVMLFAAGALCIAISASLLFAAETGRERKGQVTFEVKVAAPADAKEVRVWIPYPESDDYQSISNVKITGNFTNKGVQRDTASDSSILYAEWNGASADRTLVYSFTASRREVVNRDLPDGGTAVSPEFKEYLDLSWLGPTEQKIRQQAAEITKGKTTTLAKARAIYEWVADNMQRDPDAKACGLCNVEKLLASRMGKCADVHTVFVSLMRSAGIPARDIWGIRMLKEKEGDMTKKQHCWAEFYLAGRGWVPVDAADVHKIVFDRKLKSEDAKKLPEREYFFGSIDEYRIKLGHVHGKLTPAQKGAPLVYFMYPYAEADGKQIGEDINQNFGYKYSFKEI